MIVTLIKVCLLVCGIAAAVIGTAYWYALVMPGRSHSGTLPASTDDEAKIALALRAHVEGIASRPHNTYFPAELERSATYIEQVLKSLGYQPLAQKFTASDIEVRNIEVVLEPRAAKAPPSQPITTLVVGAHYDSAGNAPGANDNGSGSAALLVIAERLKAHVMTTTRLRLVFFVNEEPPHFKSETMGSLVYARQLAKSGESVRGMISLETLGAYSDKPGSQRYPEPLARFFPNVGNFVAVVGIPSARSLAAEVTRRFRDGTAFPSVGGVAPGSIPGITWSDHWSFGQFNIPAVMITDTALFRYAHYHRPSDTPDKLDYESFARVTGGLVRVIAGMAN